MPLSRRRHDHRRQYRRLLLDTDRSPGWNRTVGHHYGHRYGTGNLIDSETFTITVNDINTAPVLGAIGNQTVDELATLTFTATATDADLPADTLTFSLDAPLLQLGMSIDANTGDF